MILTIDVGNSNIVISSVDGERIVFANPVFPGKAFDKVRLEKYFDLLGFW